MIQALIALKNFRKSMKQRSSEKLLAAELQCGSNMTSIRTDDNANQQVLNTKVTLIGLLEAQGYSVITINLTPKGEQNDNHNIGTSEVKEIINFPHHESNRLVKSKG